MAAPIKNEKQYSVQETLQEERYLWMSRAFSLVALLAFIANILMLVAISGLTPLLRVQPFYLQTQDKDHQVISIIRPDFSSMEQKDFDLLQEALVREYLLARFGIGADVKDVDRRWGIDGIIFAMSETSVYKTFQDTESEPMLKQATLDGLTRDVHIKWVNRKERFANGGVWVAEIELVDMSQKIANTYTSKWKITMEVGFQPVRRKMDWAQRLKNPLGFVVKKFGRLPVEENAKAS